MRFMTSFSRFSIPFSFSQFVPALALVVGMAVTALSGVAQAQEKAKESESAVIDVTPKGCPMKFGMNLSAAGLDIKHEPQAASFMNARQPARAPRMRSVWMFQTGVGFVAVMHAPHFDPVQGQLTQDIFDEIISGMRGEVAPTAKKAPAAKPQSGPNLVDHEIKADRAHFVLGKLEPLPAYDLDAKSRQLPHQRPDRSPQRRRRAGTVEAGVRGDRAARD